MSLGPHLIFQHEQQEAAGVLAAIDQRRQRKANYAIALGLLILDKGLEVEDAMEPGTSMNAEHAAGLSY